MDDVSVRTMSERDYRMIPVDQINVVNSRERDKKQFEENVRSIGEIVTQHPDLDWADHLARARSLGAGRRARIAVLVLDGLGVQWDGGLGALRGGHDPRRLRLPLAAGRQRDDADVSGRASDAEGVPEAVRAFSVDA